jgi:hypothetical protein
MRILGELRALGFEVSNSTVRRYRGTTVDRSRQHWTTFYRNHGPFLAEALHVAAADGVQLVLTWIAPRLKLRRPNFERDSKRRTTSARANLVVSAGGSSDPSRLPRESRPQLAHPRDGPTTQRRAA